MVINTSLFIICSNYKENIVKCIFIQIFEFKIVEQKNRGLPVYGLIKYICYEMKFKNIKIDQVKVASHHGICIN